MAQVINTSDVALAAITPRTNSVTSGGNVIVPGAKELRLTNTVGFFRVSRDGSVNGTTAAAASITFNASRIYLGTAALTWSTSPSVTLTGTGDTRTLTYDNMGANERVVVTASLLDTDGNTYSDSISIAKLLDGSDSLTVVLSNDSCVVPANVLGQTQSYIGTGTTIEVYEGSQKLTYVTGTINSSNFSISSVVTPTAKLTVGTVTGANTTTATVANHSALADDTDLVTVVYTITAKRSNGTQQTLTATQNISKTRAGLNYGDARSLYTDPSFQNGLNSVTVYNNGTGGTVTVTRAANQADSPFANSSSYNLTITGATGAAPGLGGFVQSTTSRSNAIFLQRIVAKIPVGYTIQYASNAIGDNSSQTWLTSQAGTGQFQEYLVLRKCGATGTFSSTGHIYLTGTAPVTWYVAYAAMYDFTGPANLLVSARLSRDSVVLAADSSGTVSDFTQATSTFSVYNGSVDDSANWTFSVTPGAGITGTASNSNRTYTVTALSQDTSTVTFTATRSGYATLTSTFALAKARAGASGSNAAYVVITGDQAFKFLAGSATPTQTSVTLSAALYGGLSTYDWEYYDGSVWQNFASNTSQTFALAYNNAAWGSATTLRVRCVSGVYNDEVTIVKLYDGSNGVNAVSGYLTNEAHTIPASSTGTVNSGDYAAAGGTFKVFNGTTDVTTSSTFTIVGTPSGITAAIGASTGVYTLSAMTVDTTVVTFRATYGTTTIDKVYSITKSKTGSSGQRGSVTAELSIAGTAWSDASANQYFTDNYSGIKVLNDRITLYNAAQGFAQTKYWSGSAWIAAAAVVDGNLIVTGTITGDKVAANTITADRIDSRGLSIKDANGTVIFSSGIPQKNILNSGTWTIGTSGTQTGFGENPTSSGGSNSIQILTAPDGTAGPGWTAISGSAAGNSAEGGWNGSSFSIDHTKPYRFTVWLRRVGGLSSGSYYLGVGGTVVNISNGASNSNAYFLAATRADLPDTVWCLAVGYIWPSGTTDTALSVGGLYNGQTGALIRSAVNFKWSVGQTTAYHRTYQYYTTAAGNRQDFFDPRVELVNGTEPSIAELLATAAPSARNRITSSNSTTYIDTAAITNGQIGNVITSLNFNGVIAADGSLTTEGTQGWAITKTGASVFRNVKVTGDITATGGTFNGAINATSGTFGGSLNAATGTFNGTVAAGSINVANLSGTATNYNSDGTFYPVVPAEMTQLKVTLVGGGGGGGGLGGGGGGGLAIATLTVTPGETLTLIVGAGGTANAAGGLSRLSRGGTTLLTAGGGGAGGDNGGAGGTGTTSGQAGGVGYFYPGGVAGCGGGTIPDSYSYGNGGNSGGNYGLGATGPSSEGGQPGGLYGGGGRGGGGIGARGKAILEFNNPNGVVIRSEWTALINQLKSTGHLPSGWTP